MKTRKTKDFSFYFFRLYYLTAFAYTILWGDVILQLCIKLSNLEQLYYYILKRRRRKQTHVLAQWLAFSGCEYTITFDVSFQVLFELQIP